MNANEADIRRWTLDEIAGTLSEEDKEKLHHAIAADVEALSVWQEVQSTFASSSVRKALDRLPEKLPLEVVLAKAKRTEQKPLHRIITIGVAAVALGVIVVTVVHFFNRQSDGGYAHQAPKQKIELVLPGGNTVDLSREQDQIQVGRLRLTNKQQSLRYSSINNSAVTGIASLRIPAGKDYKILLSDGTEVWLNAATTLQFPLQFSGATREVSINGEAYLKVAPYAEKPFVVRLPYSTVHVLGTEFNVNTYETGRENVALVAGRVRVNTGKDSALLRPGYEATLRKSGGMQVRTFDRDILSWRQGIFIFQDATLEEVFKVVPRWYGVRVVLDNPDLRNRRFFGIIDRKQPVQELLKRIKAINHINYYYSKDSVIHIK